MKNKSKKRKKKYIKVEKQIKPQFNLFFIFIIFAGMLIALYYLSGIITGFAIFETSSQSDFDEGTYFQTFYNTSGFIQLNATYSTGNYTSKVFDAGGSSQWNSISWTQGGYYQQELLNNKGIENGLGGANMTGNVLLMHMNEGSGSIVDYSGEGNNGTTYGVTYGVDGKFGKALKFDGVDDKVVITESTKLNLTNQISYGAWFKADSLSTWAGVMSRMRNWGNGYNLQVGTSQKIACGWGQYTESNFDSQIGKWYFAVCVYNGTHMTLYVNGVKQNSNQGQLKTGPDDLNLGVFYTSGSLYFNGTIDEVFVFNRTLSQQEISDMYKKGVLKLNLSVRSCDDTTCSGESWTDLNDTSPQNLSAYGIPDNRYFQYKFEFKTNDVNYTPNLYNISINYLDFTPPSITIISPIDYNAYYSDWVEANVSISEAGNCNFSLDNLSYLPMDSINSTYFYKNISNLTEGLHNITFNCSDIAGNNNISLRYFTISFNPSCSNGLKDQDESDIDCGGICGGNCNDQKMCNNNFDCLNDVCEGGICVSCTDNIKNQNESDIDCGGVCGSNCDDTKTCNNGSDCSSGFCENNICVSCSDGILNQGEDLVDCGGPHCDACPYLPYLYDDCGNPANETHLIQGTDFTFVGGINSSLSAAEKSVSYNNDKVIYRYPVDNIYDYQAKIKLLQPTGAGRIQNILADSGVLDSSRSVPEYNPSQYTYKIPTSSYANDSSFDLIFEKVSGANAVCSEIEVWKSTSVSSSLSKSSYVFDFNNPVDYTYNSSEIIVENSSAHLVNKLAYGENSSFYDFNPAANDLSYGSYNLKTIFNLSKTYDYYNYSIELKRNSVATGMFQIAVNNVSNIINVTNASTISESYNIYTVNIPAYMITDNTPEIWTLTKPNILFRMDSTPLNNSYYRNANDNLNNTGWNLDNNDYYHVLIGYDNVSSSSGVIETNDLTVSGLLRWLNVSIHDYNGDVFSSESNESYDYASNQTGATASAQGGAEHLIDEDETINGSDYYAYCNWPCNMTITFNKSAYINKIYTHLWDGSNRYYNYSLWISEDGANWTKVVNNKYAQGPQNDTFNATLTKYLKIEGLYNTANNGFHVIEVDAFEAKREKEIRYYYSTDLGNNWYDLPLGGNMSNATISSGKIRFKANISGDGILYDINVSYYTSIVANCSDGIKNQDETDVDCGGNTCSKCSNGESCLANLDCQSDLCSDGVCQSSGAGNNGNDGGGAGSGESGGANGIIMPVPVVEEAEEQEIKTPESAEDFTIRGVDEILSNEITKVLFDEKIISIDSIEISTNENANDVLFKIRELDKIPNMMPELNNTYRYFEIIVENLSNNMIKEAIIKFNVNKSWMETNKFDSVLLYRYYNNSWIKLKTEKSDEDNLSIYYKAQTPGFSYFAVVGQKAEVQEEITLESPAPIEKQGKDYWKWVIFTGMLILVVIFISKNHHVKNYFKTIKKRCFQK